MKDLLPLSQQIEHMLVRQNVRGMATLLPYLKTGSYLRAARLIAKTKGLVLIGTGFPVGDSFETDGPVGAIVLYQLVEKLGARAMLACGYPLFSALKNDYACLELPVNSVDAAAFALQALQQLEPELIISIERPGLAADGRYYNMRAVDISARCANFDVFFQQASCPTIAIGDGGNEIGMGNLYQALSQLAITPAVTGCDELLLADVSNWAAYGLLALVSAIRDAETGEGWLLDCQPAQLLQYLVSRGCVDGVTGLASITEDSLPPEHAMQLIRDLQQLCFEI
ncbi:hypothetical protein Rhein_2655 [Rheinheimera sp. A13L]|uniref:glutamate cyclase domain-containing protein n=1 Tax=Rheinheimera sp. A13L TaxID=506534 RepID=UPI00021256CB|nr:glutamate cyclase domain-containing protein [Rheinheimera sp. A13L]EGM77373.1 hypothetical protein Rhein_2655 [Rheinheimera sp. A13L]